MRRFPPDNLVGLKVRVRPDSQESGLSAVDAENHKRGRAA